MIENDIGEVEDFPLIEIDSASACALLKMAENRTGNLGTPFLGTPVPADLDAA